MASVVIRDVRKAFGLTPVIHGVDIDIEDGEFVVLVGPSGCGKSTLLRMIAGLENITGGEIRIGDRVVNDLPPKERDIAMVFQNYALYPHMTVADNMAFSLKLRGAPKAEIATARQTRRRNPRASTELLDRYPRQLSGGQRQRVAMGRAIVRDPQVFLFDEPLSNLDAKLRVQMRTEIKELHQRLKTTTVYVTHDQIEAMTMADKIVVMHDGMRRADRRAARALRPAGQPVRRRLHRLAGDELPARARSAPTATRRVRRPRRRASAACVGAAGERRPARGLRHPARAFHARRRRRRGRGPGGRADRLGDPDRRRDRRHGNRRRVFRERHHVQAGRNDPAQARSRGSCICSMPQSRASA